MPPRLLVALLSLAVVDRAVANLPPEHWVGSWACSSQLVEPANRPPVPSLDGVTLRQIVRLTLGGKRIRLRLSNVFGDAPVTLASAHVARSAGSGAIVPATDRPLAFAGTGAVTLPRGAPLISDPLDYEVAAGADLAITLRFASSPRDLTGHPGSRTTSYFSREDSVAAERWLHPLTADHWYFIDGLDVVAAEPSAAALVVLGDSITDGRGSTTNGNNRWPDRLAQRLQSGGQPCAVAVLNEGIGGNRLLRDGLGPSALARFDRDVIAQTGVRWVVIFEGINDLGTAVGARARGEPGATAGDIIFAYQQCIVRAHAHGLRVCGGTITPFQGFGSYYREQSENDRQEINRWIRHSGQLDGVIDFDAATRDPKRPSRLDPACDSSDHLHLNPRGYERMAQAVDLSLFRP